MIGATRSMFAMSTPVSAMRAVNRRALSGSPLQLTSLKIPRKGIIPSFAMACNKRGAPVKEYIKAAYKNNK